MKNLLSVLAFSTILFFGCGNKEEIQNEKTQISASEIQEFQNVSARFSERLRTTLMTQMQSGGVISAINVCSDSAQIITNSVAENEGMIIKRVSEKFRNPKNEPNEIEKEILNKFEELHEAGNLKDTDYEYRVVKNNGKDEIIFMKPIFVQGPCVNCHGDENQIDEKVKELISEKYPNDLAKNYKPGDFRGAIVVTKVN